MAFEWFRSWHGAPTDSKFLLIAKRAQVAPGMVSAVYWALLDYASQNEPRGSADGFDTETYAEWAGWEEREVIAIIAALTNKGAIIDGRIAAWEKRQPKKEDPGAADRMRKMRDAKRNTDVTQDESVTDANVTDGYAVLHDVTLDHSSDHTIGEETRQDKKRIDERVTKSDDVLHDVTQPSTYPPGFEAFETNFRLNLLTAVKERDPRQQMAGGFSLSDASKAMLVQVQGSGTLLTAKSIDWALDQWEAAKPTEKFRVQDKGCVNWLLTTISNSYKPTRKAGKNGTDPSPFPSPVKDGKLRMVYEDGTIEEVEAMTNG